MRSIGDEGSLSTTSSDVVSVPFRPRDVADDVLGGVEFHASRQPASFRFVEQKPSGLKEGH